MKLRVQNRDDGVWLDFGDYCSVNMTAKLANTEIIKAGFNRWFEELWKEHGLTSKDEVVEFRLQVCLLKEK